MLREGVVKCFLSQDNGKDFVQEFFGPGELFGEVEVFTHAPSFCHIAAVTAVTAFRIGHDVFSRLLQEDGHFNRLITTALAEKVRYKALRHAYNQSHTAPENLQRLLDTFPDLLLQIPKRDIASYLGIELRSLNRLLTDRTNHPPSGANVSKTATR